MITVLTSIFKIYSSQWEHVKNVGEY